MIDFSFRYVFPHNKASRQVTESDLPRILAGDGTESNPGEAHILYSLCYTPRIGTKGRYNTAFAMANPQIDDKDPLALFVTRNAQVIINPRIIRHTSTPLFKREGCMTFPDEAPTMAPRYRLITVVYQTITEDGKLSGELEWELKDLEAQIWQHEIDHLNAKYIYDLSKAVSVPQSTDQSNEPG